jgi:crotonobetainyl-CoA:carnitine CoA-transferase CaiB-like acyl-CoA transferase
VNGINAALYAREKNGKGQYIEVSLFDTALSTTIGFGAAQFLYTGKDPTRWGNTSPDTSPTGVFKAKDADFYISCTTTKLFQKLFTQIVDRPDIAFKEDYQTPPGRLRDRDYLVETLAGYLALESWAHWQEKFRSAGVPAGQVRSLRGALDSPEARERKLVTRIPQGDAWVPNIASPLRFSETPVVDPIAAPRLGEHTEAVMREVLAYDDGRIAELWAAGAFGAA